MSKSRITIAIIIALIIIIFLAIKLSSNDEKTSTNGESINGMRVANCTSTASDQPSPLSDWKVDIYSAPLTSPAATPDKANNVRTFSYKGIKDKTEANSMYAELRKVDGSTLDGYNTTMEVCNANNKASYGYVTANSNEVIKANEGITAKGHAMQAGGYLFEPGTYRIDTYIRDLTGKWNFVARVSNITITE